MMSQPFLAEPVTHPMCVLAIPDFCLILFAKLFLGSLRHRVRLPRRPSRQGELGPGTYRTEKHTMLNESLYRIRDIQVQG
jgi:hypothetical protein